MKYYDLFFAGVIRLLQRTQYEDVAEYLASWIVTAILEIHLVILVSMVYKVDFFRRAYFLIPVFIILFVLNLRYYRNKRDKIVQINMEESRKDEKNLGFGEGVALIIIFESVMLPILVSLISD